jgi:hypothetical protein
MNVEALTVLFSENSTSFSGLDKKREPHQNFNFLKENSTFLVKTYSNRHTDEISLVHHTLKSILETRGLTILCSLN